eukprot:IDg21428t1
MVMIPDWSSSRITSRAIRCFPVYSALLACLRVKRDPFRGMSMTRPQLTLFRISDARGANRAAPVPDPTPNLEHMPIITPSFLERPMLINAIYETVFSLDEVDVTRRAVLKLTCTNSSVEIPVDVFACLIFGRLH